MLRSHARGRFCCRPFETSAEFVAHGRQEFVREVGFPTRTEALLECRAQSERQTDHSTQAASIACSFCRRSQRAGVKLRTCYGSRTIAAAK